MQTHTIKRSYNDLKSLILEKKAVSLVETVSLKTFAMLSSSALHVKKAFKKFYSQSALILKKIFIVVAKFFGFKACIQINYTLDQIKEHLSKDGRFLKSLKSPYNQDPKLVKMACLNHPEAIRFADPSIKYDEQFIKDLYKHRPEICLYFDETNRESERLLMTMIRHDPSSLQYFPQAQKGNRRLVYQAVYQDPFSCQFAAFELRDSERLMTMVASLEPEALEFASCRLKEDPFFIPSLKNNEQIILSCISRSGLNLKFASNELKNNLRVVLIAVRQNGLALQYASDSMKAHERVVRTAYQQNPQALNFAPAYFRERIEVQRQRNINARALGLSELLEGWLRNYHIVDVKKRWSSQEVSQIIRVLASHPQASSLEVFLRKLEAINDFKIPISRNLIYQQIGQFLYFACENQMFSEVLFEHLVEASSSCGDRAAFYLNEIASSYFLYQKISSKVSNAELAYSIICCYRKDLVIKIALDDALKRRLNDQIEVTLYYQLQLKKALDLPLGCESMLFPDMAHVSFEALENAKDQVLELTKKNLWPQILSKNKLWQEKIKVENPEQFNKLSEEFSDQISSLMNDSILDEQTALDQVAFLSSQREAAFIQLIENHTRKILT